jgi:hypothetical protein
MIGGIERRVPTRAGRSALEPAVRAVRQFWPKAVFENAETGDRYDEFWEVPLGRLDEIFVYRDAAAADGWEAEGAVPRLRNTMVHLIADEDAITVVVDEKDSFFAELIDTISSALGDDLFALLAAG